jgi:periplasmic protein TonB
MKRSVAGPTAENERNDLFPGMRLEETPIWSGLYENVRETLFPRKLPPLELTSTPIPVADRMASKTSPWALGTATVVNAGILAIAILLGLKAATKPFSDPTRSRPIGLSDLKLPLLAKADGGGSGGSHQITDPIRGNPPKVEVMPVVPPQVPIIDHPKLAFDPAIAANIKLPEDTMPNIGVAKSPNVTLPSNGPGTGGGIGWDKGGGVGPGAGPGWGPGSGEEVYVGGRGGVTAPVPIFAPEAEFSDEARREKYQGTCMVALIVDAHGNPQSLRVVQHLGMGLDEKALEAIRRYRFKPAMKDGKPVAAMMTVEVDFLLF